MLAAGMPNLTQILDARTSQDIRDLIDSIKREVGTNLPWKDVGDRENNLATINMGTDPAGGLTERITNAIDAVLDLEWHRQGQPPKISSPREAAESWFDIEDGKLSSVENMRSGEFRALRNRVRVSLHDSGKKKRPTIDIRDTGIGLRSEQFADSILSLNRSRKLRKFHLAGAYGQGGSTALAYAEYTLVVSKASGPRSRDDSPVAFTVVRFNEGDYETDKHGTYEYMVDPGTGQPFTLSDGSAEFDSGTLVRQVTSGIGKYDSAMTSPTSGLYYLAHHYLFDPILPFLIEECRSDRNSARRTVAGNNRRLSTSDILEYDRSSRQDFHGGEVTISWWVLSAEDDGSKKPRNRIKNYTLPSKPVVVTYNGQKQGEFSNTVIKSDLKLPYLERFLVVHVDCDSIDNKTRRELFPTTRESLRNSGVSEDLRQLIVDTLDEDENLRRLDRERKKRYLQRTDSDSADRMRKRLSSRIQSRLRTDGRGGPEPTPPTPSPDPRPEPEPIPVEEPPSFIRITSTEPREIHPGRRFTLSFKTDAKPSYFRQSGSSFLPIVNSPELARYTGATSVRKGHGKAHFVAAEDVDVGTEGLITLEVRPDHAGSFNDGIDVKVTPYEPGPGGEDGQAQLPNVTPHAVQRGDDFWNREGWDEHSVAKVVSDDESTDVFISVDNRNLNTLIERAQRRSTATGTVDAIKDFYIEHVGYHTVVAHLDASESDEDANESDIDSGDLERERERELRRVSSTVHGIMEDFFDVIAQEQFRESAFETSTSEDQQASEAAESVNGRSS